MLVQVVLAEPGLQIINLVRHVLAVRIQLNKAESFIVLSQDGRHVSNLNEIEGIFDVPFKNLSTFLLDGRILKINSNLMEV